MVGISVGGDTLVAGACFAGHRLHYRWDSSSLRPPGDQCHPLLQFVTRPVHLLPPRGYTVSTVCGIGHVYYVSWHTIVQCTGYYLRLLKMTSCRYNGLSILCVNAYLVLLPLIQNYLTRQLSFILLYCRYTRNTNTSSSSCGPCYLYARANLIRNRFKGVYKDTINYTVDLLIMLSI